MSAPSNSYAPGEPHHQLSVISMMRQPCAWYVLWYSSRGFRGGWHMVPSLVSWTSSLAWTPDAGTMVVYI
jgi:hypothetical protein